MRLGIIIPYRARKEHLSVSAPILSRIGHVYVVEQMDHRLFNRGKLINAGFLEFKKEFDYFAAHDVDMIPMANEYAYHPSPCHIATEAEQFGYRLPYPDYFGGVTLFPNEIFQKINGFYNTMWGWGGEDDLVRKKLIELNLPYGSRQCKFRSLSHEQCIDREARMENVKQLKAPIDWTNGLSSCQYEVVYCEDKKDYTLLQVKI